MSARKTGPLEVKCPRCLIRRGPCVIWSRLRRGLGGIRRKPHAAREKAAKKGGEKK